MQGDTLTTEKLQQNTKSIFEKGTLIKGSLWFALITVATIAGIFFYNNTGNTVKALSQISLKYILLCFGMLFADLMLGCWRNHIFVAKLNPGVSMWVSFRANVANMFMGAVTPAHGGAGPAQLYVYKRNGVGIINAFAISLINYGSTLIFMPLAGFIAIMFMDTNSVSGIVPPMLRFGFTFFLLLLAGFLLAFWKPLWINLLLQKLAAFIAWLFPKKATKIRRWSAASFESISKYQQTCSLILKQYPYLFPLSFLLTAVLYLNKYCMQYVILTGLGVPASLTQVISIQVLIQFMIYFAPSPGGSGFAELSISVLFARIVPVSMIPLFTLLQRSFLLFLPALLGAFVVINLLRKQTQGSAVIAEE